MRLIAPRNKQYIRHLHLRGLCPNTIHARIMERLVWVGPIPCVPDIEDIILGSYRDRSRGS